jgi:hypothetical protein
MPITTNVVSSNPVQARCTRYNIKRYKVCQWLGTGWWFSSGTPVSSTNKTDSHDITEVLLKVVLNTITLLHFSAQKVDYCSGFTCSSYWNEENKM